jgi:phosphoesterase RecJ-like protein
LRIAAELLEHGVDPWEMTVRVYEQQPLARMKLLAEVLGTLQLDQSGKLATIIITRDMVARTGTHLDLTDGFINYARAVDGVEVAASFTEPEDGARVWYVSFRSRGNVDVSRIAQRFGGGGHHNAAGCSIEGDAHEVRALIAREVEEALEHV